LILIVLRDKVPGNLYNNSEVGGKLLEDYLASTKKIGNNSKVREEGTIIISSTDILTDQR
jgi:hypothetical protein